ncbi:hypothetical protein Hdeb2414_s0008g00281351 [Helianthus debilis subsp. tardiflorus]
MVCGSICNSCFLTSCSSRKGYAHLSFCSGKDRSLYSYVRLLQLPSSLTKFLVEFLPFHEVHLSQVNPFGLAKVCHFELSCRGLGSDPDLNVFRAFYKLNWSGNWYTFEVRNKNACCYSWITSRLKDWKDRFFLIDDRCVPPEMSWRLKRSRLPDPLPKDFLGSGDVVDVDPTHALEKYVPEWSLANKDRIVDALSAKMALFHLGTPAEHAYNRKMSGPELGNALMMNQAQSNSLVVEAYKRWVEAESNFRRFEYEVASLKSEESI